jgi:O-antigen/teichoic acid export membrane protein
MGLGFLSQTLLSRTLGMEQFGVFTYWTSWSAFVLVFCKFELDYAAVRFVSAYAGDGALQSVRQFLRFALRRVALLSAGVILGAVGLLHVLGVLGWTASSSAGSVALAILPLNALLLLVTASLQGSGQVMLATVPVQILRPVGFLIILLTAMRTDFHLTAARAFAANGFAILVALVCASMLLTRWLKQQPVGHLSSSATPGAWWHAGVGITRVTLLQTILSSASDVIIVGSLLSHAAAGAYGVAMQLASFASLPAVGAATVAMPKISEYFSSGRLADLQAYITRVNRYTLLLTAPAALLLLAASPLLVRFYRQDVSVVFPVLVIGCLVFIQGAVGGNIIGHLANMSGHERQTAHIVAICAMVYLACAIPATLLGGTVGTALATLTSYLLRALLLRRYLMRTIGIDAFRLTYGTGSADWAR